MTPSDSEQLERVARRLVVAHSEFGDPEQVPLQTWADILSPLLDDLEAALTSPPQERESYDVPGRTSSRAPIRTEGDDLVKPPFGGDLEATQLPPESPREDGG